MWGLGWTRLVKTVTSTFMLSSLLDRLGRPLHDFRISVIDRCNFRCSYCMPQEAPGNRYQFLSRASWLRCAEIVHVASAARELGVHKIRLTGGEPLLRPDIAAICEALKLQLPDVELALTTNGQLLEKFARALALSGLDRVTVSLDSLVSDKFRAINTHGDVNTVLRGIDALLQAGFSTVKINCVLQAGVNDDEILDFIEHFKLLPCEIRFIETMDVGTKNGWNRTQVLSAESILKTIASRYVVEACARRKDSDVATRYYLPELKLYFGIIASITQPFCDACTRLRMSADGKLFDCLFSMRGLDLMPCLRPHVSCEALKQTISQFWQARTAAYSKHRSAVAANNGSERKIEMYQIGG